MVDNLIVVGFDGSSSSEQAIDLAAAQAACRGLSRRARLRVAYMHVGGAPFGPGQAMPRCACGRTLATGRARRRGTGQKRREHDRRHRGSSSDSPPPR